MTRFVNMIKVAAVGLSSMYLLQIAGCTQGIFSNRDGGISVLPNISQQVNLNPLNLINTLTQGLAT